MPESLHNITPEDKEQSNMRRMNGEEIPPLRNVKPELSDIVLKACSYDRNKRYASPSEMKEALLRMLRTSSSDESSPLEEELPSKVSCNPIDEGTAQTIKDLYFEPSYDSSEKDTVPSTYGANEIDDNTGPAKQILTRPSYRKVIEGVIRTAVLMVLLIALLPESVGMPAPIPPIPMPYISPMPSIVPDPIPIPPGVPDRFPGPSSWPRDANIRLDLNGIRSADMLDQPSANGNLVETIRHDAILEYLSIYEKDADSDVVYWLKVRSILSGNEGYIRSSMLQANIYNDNNDIAKVVAFNRNGYGWIRVYKNDGHIINVGYNSERAISWTLIVQ